MSQVTLRRLGDDYWAGVLALSVAPDQQHLVASVEQSRREVEADASLTAYAIHDGSQRGLVEPAERPVGFAVTETVVSVGFILRLLIDEQHQRQGYGRAAMLELVRRLRLSPDVEMVATSHRADNETMAQLCASLGFVAWPTPFEPPAGEFYLRLPF